MATVSALKPCYCGTPTALREPGDQFEYHGPKASYLELLDGDWEAVADPVSQAAVDGRIRPVSDEHKHAPSATDPLDHDGNGKKGGAAAPPPKAAKPVDVERAAVIGALKAAKIKFFAGKPTEELKKLLPA